MGGAFFSVNMLWAQLMPFVALWMYKMEEDVGHDAVDVANSNATNVVSNTSSPNGNDSNTHSELLENNTIGIFLTCSFVLWLLMNVLFFCTIDLSYLHTFFDLKTGPEYTIERYLTTTEDHIKFDAVFMNRLSFTKPNKAEIAPFVPKPPPPADGI